MSSNKTYDVNYFKKLAKSMGGKCLSSDYVNLRNPLKFECSRCNYIWNTAGRNLIAGHFCPRCANSKKHDIETMQKWAAKHGGRCLSKVYIDNRTKLEWECEKAHTWNTRPTVVQQGGWCPTCYALLRK